MRRWERLGKWKLFIINVNAKRRSGSENWTKAESIYHTRKPTTAQQLKAVPIAALFAVEIAILLLMRNDVLEHFLLRQHFDVTMGTF